MKEPTQNEVRVFLQEQMRDWRRSYTNNFGPNKGEVTDKNALSALAHLEVALRLIPHTLKRKKGKA